MKIFRQFRSRRGQQEEVGEVEFTGSYSVMEEDVMVAEVTSAFKCEDDKEEEEKQAPVIPEAKQIMTDEAHDQSTKSSTKAKTIKRVVSSILPHVEPLKWTTFVCLSVWCSIPAIIYILLFTQIGLGESLYYLLSQTFGEYAYLFAWSLVIAGFFFYILDIGEWNTTFGNIIRFFWVFIMFGIFCMTVMLTSNEYPFGLISLFALFNPLWLLMVKSLFYRNLNARSYLSWLSGPLLLVSLLTATSFTVWIFIDHDNEWNETTKVEAAIRTGCEPDFSDNPNCVSEYGSDATCFSVDHTTEPQTLIFPENCDRSCLNVYSACSNGFIVWYGPALIGMSLLFHSFFCTFLRTSGTNDKHIFNFGRLWVFVMTVMWASASLAGAGAGVSSSLLMITIASLAGSFILLSASYSREELKHNRNAALATIHTKFGDNLDIARGLFVVTCSPIIVAYFILSALNQILRRIGINPCSQPSCETDSSNAGLLTLRAKKQLNVMRGWNRAKVFTFAIYWGIAFMILQVLVAKLTVVFLSWMIERTANFGLAAVTGIMIGVGVLMFLLPPVPGLPVYLALGIVLPAQGHELMGWTWSIVYSSAVGLFLKLASSALQQVLFGQKLSHYVQVRQFVGINSILMKAMRLVVGKKGLSISKAAILIGGPDWPTSVLCGIMRLSVFQIMIGTIPTIILVIPSCLTGTLLYMASLKSENGVPQYPWAFTVSTITAAFTAGMQFCSMLVAAHYLERAVDQRSEEVAAIEDDMEVKEADARDEHVRNCYKSVTEWNAIPLLPKVTLVCSLVVITASCYMVQFFTSLCFVDYSLTDTIDGNLEGNAANLFLPLGWVAAGCFFGSMILLIIFTSWGKRQAKILAESGRMVSLDVDNSVYDMRIPIDESLEDSPAPVS